MFQMQRQPAFTLSLLVVLVLINGLIFTALGMVIGGFVYGFNELSDFLLDTGTHLGRLRILQMSSSFGMFVLPPVLLAKIGGKSWANYLQLNPVSNFFLWTTLLVMLVSIPTLEWTVILNQKMHLPDGFKGIEQWMHHKEDLASELTRKLLIMPNLGMLFINLLMLALLPAIGEEFIFRGCVQRILSQWTKSHHVGIWLTAIVFSAIHVQFFGFLPRMLLGGLLGYLLFWSGSLYVSILAHFINNALVVMVFYYDQRKGLPVGQIDRLEPNAWYIYLISFVLTFALLYSFYRNSIRSKK